MPIVKTGAFVDIHVHLREPGQTHKETIETGCRAALRGGFGAVAAMPNTTPVIDAPELVRFVLEKANGLPVKVYPVAAATVGSLGERLTDYGALREAGAVAFSDDGKPITNESIMREAIKTAHTVGLPLLCHCEPETEQAEHYAFLAGQTGCPVHICHISRAETVSVLRKAKARGVQITGETAPHYMVTWANGIMNPPLTGERDVEAVLDALCDGVIDCIATDHAPHTDEEKQGEKPLNGVIGLETALSVVLEALYHTKRMKLSDIFIKMRENPARILGVPAPELEITVDTDKSWTVGCEFYSKSRNTAFQGAVLRGAVLV